jgi:hypothetical protein
MRFAVCGVIIRKLISHFSKLLDEKWFYIKSKQSVIKIISPSPGKTVKDAFV